MARQQEDQVAFLNPDTATSGLRNLFHGTITKSVYEPWDFKGKAKPSEYGGKRYSGVKMALHHTIEDIDDGDPKPEEVYWPAGAIEDFAPSDDGRSFTPITGRKGFSKDSEIIQGVNAIIDTGAVKKSDLAMDPSIFEGLRFFWERKPPTWAKERETPSDGSKQKDVSNLMPTKFVESVGGGGKKSTASKPAASAAAKGSKREDPEEEEAETDTAITDWGIKLVGQALDDLPDKQNTIGREDLGSEVLAIMLRTYKKEIDKPTRALIGELFENDEFLIEHAGKKTWKYNARDGEVTKV